MRHVGPEALAFDISSVVSISDQSIPTATKQMLEDKTLPSLREAQAFGSLTNRQYQRLLQGWTLDNVGSY